MSEKNGSLILNTDQLGMHLAEPSMDELMHDYAQIRHVYAAGIREITCDGECGIMVPAYSLRKYAELLNRALADEELQKRMRENCYKAAERYDLECIGQEWLALFGKL